MQTEKLDVKAKALMVCELINAVVDIFLGTFLVAYLLNITNDNIGTVSIYYIVDYAVTGIFMYFIGIMIKKYNISNVYRFGIFFKCIFVLLIVLLRENIHSYVILIALILGISETTYWGPCDNLVGLVTNNQNRTKYTANKHIFRNILKILVPLILGTSIDLISFHRVSTYILLLTIVQVIFSFFVKVENQDSSKLQLKAFLKSLKNNTKLPRLKIVYKASVLYGVLLNLIPTIITILIVKTFKTNFQLGLLEAIFSITAMMTILVFKKLYKSRKSRYILFIGGAISFISVILLIFNIGKTEIIIFNFINASFRVILEVMFNIERFNNTANGIEEKFNIENQTFINMIMQIGRVIGYALLLLASILNDIIYFKIVLVIATIFIPIYSYYMYKLSNST